MTILIDRDTKVICQCFTGKLALLASCIWQPILAVAIISGWSLCNADNLLSSSCRDSPGCRIEYVPAEPQHKCGSCTSVSVNPAFVKIRSTTPLSC